jgi:hypothetical protein
MRAPARSGLVLFALLALAGCRERDLESPAAAPQAPRQGGTRIQLRSPDGGILRMPPACLHDPVLASLTWLIHHQAADGRWDSAAFGCECGKAAEGSCDGAGAADFDVGVTGLAILAFEGAGYGLNSSIQIHGIRAGDAVRQGIEWLLRQQQADGCIGDWNAPKAMYAHVMASLALCESLALSGGDDDRLRGAAQRAIDWLVAAQTPGAGWRYTPRCGTSDTDVTGWCLLALKAAKLAQLNVPGAGFDGIRAWLEAATDAAARTGYTGRGNDHDAIEGRREPFATHATPTAIALAGAVLLRRPEDPHNESRVAWIMRDLPAWDGPRIDFCYWYWGSMALFQYDGSGGSDWKSWRGALHTLLRSRQHREPTLCNYGSWDPVDRWGHVGGRVYATAICTLMFQFYYIYDVPSPWRRSSR